LVRRSADYCNAQLVYYTLVETRCREQAKSMAKHRKTAIEAVAYLRTSSANAGPDKDNDKRPRAAIASNGLRWQLSVVLGGLG